MTNIILPDTPSSVLQLLNADKAALEKFANSIIQDVKQGRENPLEIQLLIKKYEFVLNEIKENIKPNVNTETAKYGEKEFEYGGAKCHYTPVKTEYDFGVCGDPVWNDLDRIVKKSTADRKQREDFLKNVIEPFQSIDYHGEISIINPPNKKSTYGLKVTLK